MSLFYIKEKKEPYGMAAQKGEGAGNRHYTLELRFSEGALQEKPL